MNNLEKITHYISGICPRCNLHSRVGAFEFKENNDTFRYGMECGHCHAQWNVNYGSEADASKYVKGVLSNEKK